MNQTHLKNRSHPFLFAGGVLVAALLGLGGCSDPPPPQDYGDIILITVDTLRPDHLSLYGYERETSRAIDSFFGDGRIYERSYSTEASTAPSMISLLSGQLPQDHGVRLFYQLIDDDVSLVPDLLPEVYQTAAFVSNLVLTDEAMDIGSRFEHYDDFVDEKEPYRNVYERNAQKTTDRLLAWMVDQCDPERPLFLWLHYIDPHGPYHPPEGWEFVYDHENPREINIDKVPEFQREPGITDGKTYIDRYDEEIRYTDQHLSRFLEAYPRMRDSEKALWIFTADHGESMMEHERWFTHGYHVYDEIVRVPLMVKGAGVIPGRVDSMVSGIDVTPTILRFAGIEPDSDLSSVDLRSYEAMNDSRVLFTEATTMNYQWRAAVEPDAKWMIALRGEQRRKLERRRYDLTRDSAEVRPDTKLSSTGKAFRDLLKKIESDPDPSGIPSDLRRGMALGNPKVAPGVSEDTLEKLKALGYAK